MMPKCCKVGSEHEIRTSRVWVRDSGSPGYLVPVDVPHLRNPGARENGTGLGEN